MDNGLFVLKVACALLCGLMAGVFFAFSSFVMQALARLSPEQGIQAMNAINVEAPGSWFVRGLFATCIASAVLAVLSPTLLTIAGFLIYLAGAIGVTMMCNVPLNNALARSADDVALWSRYQREWTAWNHVRTIACLISAALLTLAVRSG